ncbi:hypothetical protein P7K49_011518 [Saguinus oedipus]|uniref:Uncharacterized protein n=1 Tax=Saguinus oedipus TaxID=9490 RepID=A0ABQ9VUE4_SAGOE|nr:hypothetical protein P7K49_011518 [Saguinus oedipus]
MLPESKLVATGEAEQGRELHKATAKRRDSKEARELPREPNPGSSGVPHPALGAPASCPSQLTRPSHLLPCAEGRVLDGCGKPGCGDMLTGTEPMPASDEGRAPGADPQHRYFYPEPGAQDAAERRGGGSLGSPYPGGALVPAPPSRFLGAYAYPPRPQAAGFPGAGESFPPPAGAEGYPPGEGYAAPDPRAGLYPGPGPREDYALPAGLEVSGKLRVALNNHLLCAARRPGGLRAPARNENPEFRARTGRQTPRPPVWETGGEGSLLSPGSLRPPPPGPWCTQVSFSGGGDDAPHRTL